MRPKPSLSNSGENGFWLMRISRMDSFGGSCPPLKPSMKMAPPFGPAEGPASASRSDCRSSALSESASRSPPESTSALALPDASALTAGPEFSFTVTCCAAADTRKRRSRVRTPAPSTIFTGRGKARSGAAASTVYGPGRSPGSAYDPSMAVAAVRRPDGALAVTLAPGTTAPLSSVTRPRSSAVCAASGGIRTRRRIQRCKPQSTAIAGSGRGPHRTVRSGRNESPRRPPDCRRRGCRAPSPAG